MGMAWAVRLPSAVGTIVFQKMIWTLRLRKSRQKLLGRRDQDFRSLNLYLKGYSTPTRLSEARAPQRLAIPTPFSVRSVSLW